MKYSIVDMSAYPRKSHFEYFKKYANPYMGMTVNIDVTQLKQTTSSRGESFFISCVYAASRAANSVNEFRQRISDGDIIEYFNCPTSHTVPLADGTYRYCTLSSDMPYSEYIEQAKRSQSEAKQGRGIPVDEDENEFIFVSCVPWESYTAIMQPTPFQPTAIPE